MSHRLLSALASIAAMVVVTFCAVSLEAQTVAPGPYYAVPSWDQILPSSTRFIVLSNWNSEAVLDRETGLVWQRTAGVALESFSLAKQGCHFARTGNRVGWRLPSVHEFRSLIDASVTSPTALSLPAGHPFVIGLPADAVYWTGTTVAEAPQLAYGTGLRTFDGLGIFTKQTQARASWCVRGGGPIGVD
jgi:hypothetical protein